MGDASRSPALDPATAEQLNNAETRRLLDTIDSLRDLRIGGIVDLPQIIVVGDQCSGKSSVLEAISRVHFPVSDGICTRFPTELVLRRAPKESTDLRIRFADESRAQSSTPFQESGFHRSELPAIINRAKEHMGLGDGKTTGFSRDVLRVEIAGPDIPSLTLVDLPGIFHSGVSSQPQEWKPVVDDMVESYMRQRSSIVLMVVSADISLSKHAILDMAARFDVARERTIGVITKVDLCPGANLEGEYLKLARGEEPNHQLRLGWHILRNRGPKEPAVDFDHRDIEEERFLKQGAWSSLPLGSRGVDSLRKNLGATLLKHIKDSLPELIRDINDNLQNRQKRLAKLGTTRTNPNEMRDYLLNISTSFHRLAEHAVEGRYNDSFFASPTVQETSKIKFRKLRALLRNLNRAFDITMRTKGARYNIEWEQEQEGTDARRGAEAEEQLAAGVADVPDYLQPFLKLYDFPDPIPKSESLVNARIERIASASQGVEFPGLPNSDLIMQLFRDQSAPWRRIAECHLDIVLERTRLFVYHLFDYVLEDDKRTRDAILAECVDPSFDFITETLQSKLSEILRPFTSGHGLPLDWEFRSGLSKRKISRMTTQIVNLLNQRDSVTYNTSSYQILKHEDVENIILEANSATVTDFGTDTVIDMMLTHYDMSLRTFTDNVIHLVVENCLISNLPDIFSTKVVTQMNDDLLKRLAEESAEVKSERSQLIDEIEKLRLGLQNCQRSRPRDFSDNFIELAPRRDAPRKPKIRVKLPFVQYAKTAQAGSPFTQLTSTKIDFTTGLKQEQDNSPSNEKAPSVAVNGGTSLKSDDEKITIQSEPGTIFGSSKVNQSVSTDSGKTSPATIAESSKNNQTPAAGSSSNGNPPASGSLFGSAASQMSTVKSSIFGGTTTAAATTTPVTAFGSVPASQAPKASAFGSTTGTTVPAFGSVPSAFGQASTSQPPVKPSFGSTTASATTATAFGSVPAPKPSAFGSTASTVTGPAFGSVTAAKPSAFGSTTTPTVTGPAFGSTTASKPTVWSSAATAAATPAFGSTPAKPLAFGSAVSSTVAAPAFGSTTTTQPPASNISVFGGTVTSKPTSDAPKSLFGSSKTTSTTPDPPSSSTGGGFFGGGSTASSTTPKPPSGSTGGLFGKPMTTTSTTPDPPSKSTSGLFGGGSTTASTVPNPPLSSTGGGLFGAGSTASSTTPKPPSGSTGGLFGKPATTNCVAENTPASSTRGLFGSPAATDASSPTPQPRGLFGSPKSPSPQPSIGTSSI
ncbi:interferon-induced gtp-binding mx3 [Trichoderma arundinaceum]|uniref:Interferon-induced gtp-binding mx3 n=1 Tax=Trichoderma arundinaceum TaxID=490622 RepID=A0A395NYG3_TRIAR|nr:interferon-induced gtp-binding mx3 [Trichoderma arundinaceum]